MQEFDAIKGNVDKVSDLMSVGEAAEVLKISADTLRNWVRLGKIEALGSDSNVFSAEYIRKFNDELEKSGRLTSRRNKSRQSVNHIAKSYISSKSPNYRSICDLFEELAEKDVDIMAVVRFYAKGFLTQRGIPEELIGMLLSQQGSDGKSIDCPGKKEVADTDSAKDISVNNVSAAVHTDILMEHPLSCIDGEDTLGMIYISLRKLTDKKASGSYYTPFFVVDTMTTELEKKADLRCCSILDPACGTGNFLLRLPTDVPIENIHGFDIDPVAVYIARINIALKYDIRNIDQLNTIFKNITVHDFLKGSSGSIQNDYEQLSLFEVVRRKQNGRYDVIIGNPPWGYSYSKKEIADLKNNFTSCKNNSKPESFDLFIEESLRCANSGIISFLLPETLLEADIHSDTRQVILDNADVLALHYIGDVFDKVQCPCVILTLKTRESAQIAKEPVDVFFEKRTDNTLKISSSFSSHSPFLSAYSFHILADDYERGIIDKIRQTEHFTLKGNADFALGIVTGDNKNLIRDKASDGYEPIVKGKEIEKFIINDPSGFIEYRPEKFQQCAKTGIYRAGSKLLYRFISDRPVVAHDKSGILTLNSANILIPEVAGYSHEYIMALLNSSVLAFYYLKNFRSLKVLRSALESLPLAVCSEDEMNNITESAGNIERKAKENSSKNSEKTAGSALEEMINALDKHVSMLYGLTDSEFSYIKSVI